MEYLKGDFLGRLTHEHYTRLEGLAYNKLSYISDVKKLLFGPVNPKAMVDTREFSLRGMAHYR